MRNKDWSYCPLIEGLRIIRECQGTKKKPRIDASEKFVECIGIARGTRKLKKKNRG